MQHFFHIFVQRTGSMDVYLSDIPGLFLWLSVCSESCLQEKDSSMWCIKWVLFHMPQTEQECW